MNGILTFIAVFFLLYVGRPILIPIIVALFLWYLLNAIAAYYRKALPFRKTRAAGFVALVLSLSTFAGLVYLFITQIQPMFSKFINSLPAIQEKLGMLQDYITNALGLSADGSWLPNLANVFSSVGSSVTAFSSALGMVIIYIIFMFIEQSSFSNKLAAIFPQKAKFKKMHFIVSSIDQNMKRYMFVKTAISALQAVLSYLWLWYLGVEFAGVWAFVVFLMNYIPTFGTIVATALPILYSLLVADSLHLPILVAIGLITLNILISNLLEPRLTGKTLNLSTLAILINLVFWGMIWGVAGMFFSVPLLVATFVITAQFDSTRWIAVLLSSNGEIPNKEDD